MKHCVAAALFALLILPTAVHAWTVEQPTAGLTYLAHGQKKVTLVFRPALQPGQQVYRLQVPAKPSIWKRVKRQFTQGKRFGLVDRQYAPVP